jgi:hypothetical protein
VEVECGGRKRTVEAEGPWWHLSLAMRGRGIMVAKSRKPTAQQIKAKGTFQVGERTEAIPAAVWGQLEPLDLVAREKKRKWGDTLPSLVSPDLAGRFHGAYEALGQAVVDKDVVRVNKLAGQLMRAWGVLEQEAEAAGHKPLPEHAYCVSLGQDEKMVCFALSGVAAMRTAHPDWIVYDFEDAARIVMGSAASDFLEEAFKRFPNAKVTRVTGARVDDELEDEIPW